MKAAKKKKFFILYSLKNSIIKLQKKNFVFNLTCQINPDITVVYKLYFFF